MSRISGIEDDFSSVSIAQISQQVNWQKKFKLLTEWGKLIAPKAGIRSEDHRIKGCETEAWIAHQQVDDRHYFYFDSESRVINGLAALLLSHVNGQQGEKIRRLDIASLLKQAGLEKRLTPSRSNGFLAIVERVKRCV